MTCPPAPRSADAPIRESRACASNQQERLEEVWRSRLLADPSDATFRDAYDALHAVMLGRADRQGLYEVSLTRLDRAFLSALGTAYRVLDIGAGNGRFSLAAADTHWVVALEISSEAITAMQALAGSRRMPAVCQASALHLPFSAESFHVAVSQDLVEHLHPDHLLSHLAEICRILVPGGRYLLHTPSSLYGSTSFGLHLREYRLREVRLMAETAGFRVRWICLNTARIGWTGALPRWILPIVETWEALWRMVGDLGLRRYAGRWYANAIPDVDLDLLKPERRCASCT